MLKGLDAVIKDKLVSTIELWINTGQPINKMKLKGYIKNWGLLKDQELLWIERINNWGVDKEDDE